MKLYLMLSLLVGINCRLSVAEQAPAPLDLTHGGKRDHTHDSLLEPTGVYGWISA